jgi:hypothetical protein
MTETADLYLEQARRQIALNDAAALEQRVLDHAGALQEADARAKLHRDLCAEHGLPVDTTPQEITAAMHRRRDEFWTRIGKANAGNPGNKLRQLAVEVGIDPDDLGWTPYDTVWNAMRRVNHWQCTAQWDDATNQFIRPAAAQSAAA